MVEVKRRTEGVALQYAVIIHCREAESGKSCTTDEDVFDCSPLK